MQCDLPVLLQPVLYKSLGFAYLNEVFKDILAVSRVVDFWMKLESEAVQFRVLHCLYLAGLTKCSYLESRRNLSDFVIVTSR